VDDVRRWPWHYPVLAAGISGFTGVLNVVSDFMGLKTIKVPDCFSFFLLVLKGVMILLGIKVRNSLNGFIIFLLLQPASEEEKC